MNSLYIHIPFCRRKCPYCDFFSIPSESPLFKRYPALLIEQLKQVSEVGDIGRFSTVFFGGGTPSLLDADQIAAILHAARSRFGFSDDVEISMEVNPGTVTRAALTGYREAGVNRLSLGVQSFDNRYLALLGRIHSQAEAEMAYVWAREAGFENISCDLMFGLPGQSIEEMEADLRRVMGLAPEHISIYGLTVEEGTPFHHQHRRGEITLPEEDLAARMYLRIHDLMTGGGYEHYEISNFSRPGYACRHNLAYWNRTSYLGIGPGAHSFFDRQWGERYEIPPDIERYAAMVAAGNSPLVSLERFDKKGAMAETLYLGLRRGSGVSEEDFRQRYGVGVAEAYPAAVRKTAGYLFPEDGSWRLSLSGWLIYDSLIQHFL